MDTAHAQLLEQARRRGIQDPERFKPAELQALLAALPAAEDQPVTAPVVTSGAAPVPQHAPALEALSKGVEAAPVYQENPFYKEPPVTVPELLGKDAIWLLAVDPETLFAAWDVSDETRRAVAEGARPVLRLQSPDAVGNVDVEIDLRADGWYMKAGWERVRVVAVLGLVRAGTFVPVVASRSVVVPPRTAAAVRATFRANIPYDLDRRVIPKAAATLWSRGQPAPGVPQVQLTPGQTPDDVAVRVAALPGPSREGLPAAPLSEAAVAAGQRPMVPSAETAETETLRFREMVLKGLRTWSWRAGGPNSSDLMMRGQEEWQRYIRTWVAERSPGEKALRPLPLPTSGVVPSSFSWPSSWGRRRES